MGRSKALRELRRISCTNDGLPYLRANPLSGILHDIWRENCELGFRKYGRGVLYRSVSVGLGKSAYVPLEKINDPIGLKVLETYEPSNEFVVAEPNGRGGTRWQVFQK